MTPSIEGRRTVAKYLNHEISLGDLNDWSLEFGDDPAQYQDTESLEIAGLITELVDDLGNRLLSESDVRARLESHINYPVVYHHIAWGDTVRKTVFSRGTTQLFTGPLLEGAQSTHAGASS